MRSLVKLLAKIPLYHSFRAFGYPKILPFNYTISLTYRCNSKCKTCNIWKIQKNYVYKELNTKEWKRIIKSLSNSPFWITISGGEPFLRTDLSEIIRYINKHNKPKFITIPTNGIINPANEIEEMLSKISKKTTLIINFSLDGIGKKHDLIRGVASNWERLLKAYHETKNLKERFDNLLIGIHTVISRWNYNEIPKIYSYVERYLKPDNHIFELAENRVELFNLNKRLLPEKTELVKIVKYILHETSKKCCEKSFYVKTIRAMYYKYLLNVLTNGKYMKSFAGFASVEISPIGKVWDCAIHAKEMGDLKDFNYDFKKLWVSKKAERVRKANKLNHRCILANEFYSNAMINGLFLLKLRHND